MRVLKFGGTSVGTPERMKSVLELIDFDEENIIVLSAFSGVTNRLVEIASYMKNREDKRVLDKIKALHHDMDNYAKSLLDQRENKVKALGVIESEMIAVRRLIGSKFDSNAENGLLIKGELISTALFQILMEEKGLPTRLIPAVNFMSLNEEFEPNLLAISEDLRAELARFQEYSNFITQGFVCRNSLGDVDNLKRGGSDYTATLIGAALGLEEIQIWTDIDGMHNNDPRVVEHTEPITHLSFEEAGELAYFGAKILHPSCVLPAKNANVPVRLKNTIEPGAKGTLISNVSITKKIKAVAAKDEITAIKIKSDRMLLAHGFLKKIFDIFEQHKTSIDMITTSEVAVSLTIDDSTHLEGIVKELEFHGSVEIDKNLTIICVVGDFIADHKGYGVQIFNALKNIPIRMISYGGSKHNVSILIKSEHKREALTSLHSILRS